MRHDFEKSREKKQKGRERKPVSRSIAVLSLALLMLVGMMPQGVFASDAALEEAQPLSVVAENAQPAPEEPAQEPQPEPAQEPYAQPMAAPAPAANQTPVEPVTAPEPNPAPNPNPDPNLAPNPAQAPAPAETPKEGEAAPVMAPSPEEDAGFDTLAAGHVVTFLAEGNEPVIINVPDGEAIGNPPGTPAILPEGAVSFRGWYLGNAEEPFDFATPITGPITITARFSTQYLIQYTAPTPDGDRVVFSRELNSGEPILALPDGVWAPPASLYVKHWYAETEGSTVPFLFNSRTATCDMVLRPFLSNERSVIFISDGTQVAPAVVADGGTLEKPADPTRPGYTFKHWATQRDSQTAYDFSTPVTADLTLYAVWTPGETTYTLVYWLEKPNLGSADVGTDTSKYEFHSEERGKTGISGTTPTFEAAQLEGIPYASYSHTLASPLLGNGNSVVNVYFKRIPYTFVFDLKPASGRTATMKFNGTTYSQSGSTGTMYSFVAKYEQDIENLWPSSANATFTYSGSGTNNFLNWSSAGLSANLVSKRFTVTTDLIPASGSTSRTFTANWGSTRNVTVEYWLESLPGESGTSKSFTNVPSRSYTKSTTLSQALILTSSSSLSAKTIGGMTYVGSGGTYSSSTTLYQFYYTRNRYNLSFETFGGTAVAPVSSIMFGENLSSRAPQQPDKEGAIFRGWYLDAECTAGKEFKFESNTMPNSHLKLFAKWESSDNAICFFDDEAGKGSHLEHLNQGVAHGASVIKPAEYQEGATQVEGKGIFNGWVWYVNGRPFPFSFDMPVFQNIDIHATWKTDGFTITYHAGAGSGAPVDGRTYELNTSTRVMDGSSLRPPQDQYFYAWQGSDDRLYYPQSIASFTSGHLTMTAQYGLQNTLTTLTYLANRAGATPAANLCLQSFRLCGRREQEQRPGYRRGYCWQRLYPGSQQGYLPAWGEPEHPERPELPLCGRRREPAG